MLMGFTTSVYLEGGKIASIDNCLTKSEAVVRGADAALDKCRKYLMNTV